MPTKNSDTELWIVGLIKSPVSTVDTALRTTFALVPAALTALQAIPKLASSVERVIPVLEAAQESLTHVDKLGTFIAEELPETQHQLDELRSQLGVTASKVADLGPQLVASTGVNRALNDSIRLLAKGLGVVQGTTDLLSGILDRLPDVRRHAG